MNMRAKHGCYMNIVENWEKKTIKALKINHGHEYLLKIFKNLYDEKLIQRQSISSRTP